MVAFIREPVREWLERLEARLDEIDPSEYSTEVATGPATVAAETGQTILVSVAAGAVTVNLPATHTLGRRIVIKLSSVATNACLIEPNGAQTIDGESSLTLNLDYEWAELISDGSNWLLVG